MPYSSNNLIILSTDMVSQITFSSCASKSWVDEFAGKWQNQRTTAQIVEDIHKAKTNNSEIVL